MQVSFSAQTVLMQMTRSFPNRRVGPGTEPGTLWLAAMAAVLLASPGLAGTFTPPQGCTPTMTVQMKGCTVSNHYTCEADTAGDKWRADFGQNGLYFKSRIDFETQWMETFQIDEEPDIRTTIELPATDPANFSELVATGNDTFSFSTITDTGVRENVTGFDHLTGRSVVIDGVTLLQTEYDAKATYDDGTVAWHSRGNEFIHPEWRLFLSGQGEWSGGDGEDFLPFNSTPMTFSFPGDPGFMATIPLFDCDVLMSSLPTPPSQPEEPSDDL